MMGTWGVKLYSSDLALDIKDEYIDQLKKGIASEVVTNELIRQYEDELSDESEAAEFWFALADTQWKYGRLIPYVKERALEYLRKDEHLQQWKEVGEREYQARIKVLDELKNRLLSQMPPEKKISVPRLYKCEWKFGDVFAYRFDSEHSKEKGFYGKYILMRKVNEDSWYPGHVIPVVHVYKWLGDEVPDIKVIEEVECLPQFYVPKVYNDIKNDKILYGLALLNTSKRIIPKKNLFYIGNIQDSEFSEKVGKERNEFYHCAWKRFEEYIIKDYLTWEDIKIL